MLDRHWANLRMKQINNTCVEVLQGLLNQTKTSTIRKAWKEELIKTYGVHPPVRNYHDIEAKYKVGEICEMVWDRDNKDDVFCTKCGKSISQGESCKNKSFFDKLLGKVKINKVYQIKLGYMKDENRKIVPYIDGEEGGFDNQAIAKREGFKNPKSMFKYFSKNYDLSKGKKFWVYEFEWIK